MHRHIFYPSLDTLDCLKETVIARSAATRQSLEGVHGFKRLLRSALNDEGRGVRNDVARLIGWFLG